MTGNGDTTKKSSDLDLPEGTNLLPAAEISALSDETYNKLSPALKQLYDSYVIPSGSVTQTIPMAVKTALPGRNVNYARNYDSIHWEDLLRMAQYVGLDEISNKPASLSGIKADESGDFRSHADSFENKIFVPPLSTTNKRLYIDNVLAELAHLDPDGATRKPTKRIVSALDRLVRAFKEGELPDSSNYTSGPDIEYQTHYSPTGSAKKLFDMFNFTNRIKKKAQ